MTYFISKINEFLDNIYLHEISDWTGDGEMTPAYNYS